jgi:uncharacterized membrane protein YoaK (UPF0700 family)
MIEKHHSINWVTYLLAWVAGFCDTATFVAGDSIFSAHVTGNFIVFAAQVASGGHNVDAWIKLLTFPVFVIAVATGGWVVERAQRKHKILFAEGIILIVGGIAAILLPMLQAIDQEVIIYLIVMTTVFGMGFQNAFGKLFAKETHGPTTMMTGNVSQASLDLGNVIRKGISADAISWLSLKKQSVTIGGFLAGCVFGAVLSKWLGLSTIVIPGVAIVICYLQEESAALK